MGARSGAAYVEGLRDDREVWIDGERVKDVTRDRRLGRGIKSVAGLYDLQLDPAHIDTLTYQSPTTGDRVGLSHIQPRSVDDLVRRRTMIKTWAEWSAGMMGRSPDFLNTLVMGCAANAEYFAQNDPAYGQNIQRYYEQVREQDLCLTHTLIAPQVNRALLPDQQGGGEVALRVVKETDAGLVVSGARILATLAPASDELFVAPAPSRSVGNLPSPRAFAFSIPCSTPGLRFICRESFDIGRSSFDHPLGSRFEEMDCTAVFNRVLVPWERVFLYGDQAYCAAVFRDTDAFSHSIHQVLSKNWAKAEFILGVATLMAEAIGVNEYLNVQRMLGEVLHAMLTIRSFVRAAEADAAPNAAGVWSPHTPTLLTARCYFPEVYPRLVEILQLIGSSGLANIPSERSIETPELADDILLYFQGVTLDGKERVRLFRLAWDIACSSFGGRQVLYERYFAGDVYRNPANHYNLHDKQPYRDMVEKFLNRTPSTLPEPPTPTVVRSSS
jgi:4-hydroxyphenylacetate 3-monooxygenase